jgi:chromosome segregation ATPase
MQACRLTQATWPVGFVADKSYLQLVEAQERRTGVTIHIAKYASDKLMQVVSFVEQLVIAVESISAQLPLDTAMSQLTLSAPSEPEDDTRERVGRLEVEVKELKVEMKGISKTLTQLAAEMKGISKTLTQLAAEMKGISKTLTQLAPEMKGISETLTQLAAEMKGISETLTQLAAGGRRRFD